MKKLSEPQSTVKHSIDIEDLDGHVALIQALIPLGLAAVEDQLQQEVAQLAGGRYARKTDDQDCRRWGQQKGSVYLADQKRPLRVPRVRNVTQDTEVPLAIYQAFQQPRALDEGLLLRVLDGLSNRTYEQCAEAVPQELKLTSQAQSA